MLIFFVYMCYQALLRGKIIFWSFDQIADFQKHGKKALACLYLQLVSGRNIQNQSDIL